MSGPPYPHPYGRSNAIGDFVIGVSPIGTLPAYDYWQTVLSQYGNSDILTGIITSFFEATDQTANMDAFFDLIWNINSAQGYGLDVWGRIVGVTRTIAVPVASYFGMEGPTGASGDPYNVSPFYTGSALTINFSLTDESYRTLILAKALANISDCSIKSINQILLLIFPGRGNCYVTDGLNMSMTYTFEFGLSAVERSIVENSGVLPRPAGVSATVIAP